MSKEEMENQKPATPRENSTDLNFNYFDNKSFSETPFANRSLWEILVKLWDFFIRFYLQAVEIFFSEAVWNLPLSLSYLLATLSTIYLTPWLLLQIVKMIKEIIDFIKYVEKRRVKGLKQRLYSEEFLEEKFRLTYKKKVDELIEQIQQLQQQLQDEEDSKAKISTFAKLAKKIDEIVEEYVESKLNSTYTKKLHRLIDENELLSY
jgi:hypothetical protein